jgi:tripartite-type tricarboxylate transporter receptor subunit TctC
MRCAASVLLAGAATLAAPLDGLSPAGGTPEEFLARIKREIELWRKVVNDAGVKLE